MATQTQSIADDENLPSPPSGAEAGQSTTTIDGSFDANDLAAVPKLGEAIPVGTYHFRAESYTEHDQPTNDKTPADELRFGAQPVFWVIWSCQQEPHTGRTFLDFINWVKPEVFAAARGGDKAAQKVLAARLSRAKMVMEGASYKPVGKSDFKAFLATNPELKIQVSLKERKSKGVGTGEMANGAVKYLSLNRPA